MRSRSGISGEDGACTLYDMTCTLVCGMLEWEVGSNRLANAKCKIDGDLDLDSRASVIASQFAYHHTLGIISR